MFASFKHALPWMFTGMLLGAFGLFVSLVWFTPADLEAQRRPGGPGLCYPVEDQVTCTSTSTNLPDVQVTSFCLKNNAADTIFISTAAGDAANTTTQIGVGETFCEEGVNNLNAYDCIDNGGADLVLDYIGKRCP